MFGVQLFGSTGDNAVFRQSCARFRFG
jgi:hypothetical protein